MTEREILQGIRDAAEEAKALDIQIVDVRGKTTVADYFLVCTGTSDVHVRSIADRISERLRARRVRVISQEGLPQATWVLMDYGPVVAHVMQDEQRAYYAIENLWEHMPPLDDAPYEPEEA